MLRILAREELQVDECSFEAVESSRHKQFRAVLCSVHSLDGLVVVQCENGIVSLEEVNLMHFMVRLFIQ